MKTIREKRKKYVTPKVLDVIPSHASIMTGSKNSVKGSLEDTKDGGNWAKKQDIFPEDSDGNIWSD